MARVLIAEPLSERGVQRLVEAGHDVDARDSVAPEALPGALAGVHALVIRSQTQVTAEVLEAGTDLVVVGRAGIGLDNVDVEAATRRGVMVVNAPQSNIVSAAEHAMALLLAQARNIAQASAALKQGRWERSRWEGVELYGKTLGVIGLGRIGALVAQRALAFGMRLCAYDPYVSADRARMMGVELMSLDDLVGTADFLTVHLPRTPDTMGLVNRDVLARAKSGIRIVNTARGGIVDEVALAWAVGEGIVAGAALDVFATEPTTSSPLFEHDCVVVTPHLGASTREAQDKAGETIGEQVALALAGEFVPYAVNVDASEASETIRPFLPMAERLGRIFSGLCPETPAALEVEYQGQLGDYDTRILTLSVLKGLLSRGSTEPVTYVNAPQLAEERGVTVRETRTTAAHDYVNLISLRAGGHSVAGTVFGLRNDARLVMVEDHVVDIPPARFMAVVRNDDRPGMIGTVGTVIGRAGVNIADMDVGRSASGEAALMVLSTDQLLSADVVAELVATDGILEVRTVTEA